MYIIRNNELICSIAKKSLGVVAAHEEGALSMVVSVYLFNIIIRSLEGVRNVVRLLHLAAIFSPIVPLFPPCITCNVVLNSAKQQSWVVRTGYIIQR